jgi:hypothetical protein
MIKRCVVAAAVALAGCATPPPSGPSMLVLPGTGKSFDLFRADELDCRGYAHAQLGGKTTEKAANDAAVKSAVVGTAVGTAVGAAVGGHQGAAVGAGVGLAGGALAGNDYSASASGSVQRRYDNAYIQCMYAKGHKVPVSGRFEYRAASSSPSASPAQQGARQPPPPPPAGTPPSEPPPDYKPK